MEPESSLPYSQVPATCPYPEPAPSSPHTSNALPPRKSPDVHTRDGQTLWRKHKHISPKALQ
jgi:hypothetical protein